MIYYDAKPGARMTAFGSMFMLMGATFIFFSLYRRLSWLHVVVGVIVGSILVLFGLGYCTVRLRLTDDRVEVGSLFFVGSGKTTAVAGIHRVARSTSFTPPYFYFPIYELHSGVESQMIPEGKRMELFFEALKELQPNVAFDPAVEVRIATLKRHGKTNDDWNA